MGNAKAQRPKRIRRGARRAGIRNVGPIALGTMQGHAVKQCGAEGRACVLGLFAGHEIC